jgi:hypothetical protein
MVYANIRVNWDSIGKKFSNAARIKATPAARKKAYNLFYRAKSKLIRRFDTHLVTLEIEAGPSSSSRNISGTLDGYGNLFSFLGFDNGSRPTQVIREALINEVYYVNNPTFRNNKWYYKVFYPSRKRIEALTDPALSRPNWSPNWVDLVEHGAPGIVNYLNLKKSNRNSASNYGFQAPYEINDDLEFKPRPYITELLANFRAAILENSTKNL